MDSPIRDLFFLKSMSVLGLLRQQILRQRPAGRNTIRSAGSIKTCSRVGRKLRWSRKSNYKIMSREDSDKVQGALETRGPFGTIPRCTKQLSCVSVCCHMITNSKVGVSLRRGHGPAALQSSFLKGVLNRAPRHPQGLNYVAQGAAAVLRG